MVWLNRGLLVFIALVMLSAGYQGPAKTDKRYEDPLYHRIYGALAVLISGLFVYGALGVH